MYAACRPALIIGVMHHTQYASASSLDSSATGSELMRPTRCSRLSPSSARSRSMIRLICFELKLDGFRGLADTVNGPDAVEERQPDEAVQRRAD
jgi:hypothetical protein